MQRSHTKVLLACIALYAGAMACADILGIQGGELGDGSSTDGGSSDGLPPYDGSGKDVIDLGDANFAQCDGGTDDTTNAVYVSNTHPNRNSSAQSCGATTQPCTSIQTAMAIAAQRTPRKVILANDTFDEVVEFDTNTHDMIVEGGYFLDYTKTDTNGNPAWVYQCTTNLAHIRPQTDARNYTIRFNGANNETLRLLTVETRPVAISYGESLHAILAIDSNVTLDNVVAVAQNGGDGAPGLSGAAQMGCITSGSSGANGPVGSAGSPGSFGSSGFAAIGASAGGMGQVGPYTPPTSGTCSDDCGTCNLSFSPDGGGSTCSVFYSQQCGGTGTTGCAGVGGNGGAGGGGGGASIAVYVTGSSSVTLASGTVFFANSGGAGGLGGSGSSGASGQTGTAGGSTTCIDSCGTYDGGSSCTPTSSHQLAGGAAGSGGQGGTGGQGGGGHGGPAYLLVRVQPANVVGSNLISNGDGGLGTGGAGGGPNGDAGESVRYKVYP